MPSRCCPACGGKVRAGHLLCSTCWYSVPKPLRTNVNATWRAFLRSRSHGRDAILAASRTYRAGADAAIEAAKAALP